MNLLSLILRIVAVVAAIAAGALFFLSKGKLDEKQAELVAANATTSATQQELSNANEQILTLEGRLKAERESLADTKRSLESVRSEMYAARQEVSSKENELEQANKSISSLESDIRAARSKLVTVEEELAEANNEGEMAQLAERIAELEKTNADISEELVSAKAKAEMAATRSSAPRTLATGGAYSSNFTPSTGAAVGSASIGTEVMIKEVSSKDGLLVLTSIANANLAPGLELTLIKDLKALGKVSVTSVTDEYAVANILPGTKARNIVAGTTVKILR